MKRLLRIVPAVLVALLLIQTAYSQTASFKSYQNPVIPGDHPDATLTRIGNDFYTTGSSFNPTPVIYHSTDLVHWEAIAQPVSASWANYGNTPGGGCWGGQIVYYNGKFWDYFSRSNTMYFVKADDPSGPWSQPVKVNNPSTLSYSLGYDNSLFIDDSSWYLVVKNGQPNNGIVELGNDGQPTGLVYDLNWLNPGPSYPYSWAEGPVMWKAYGYYYYSFAQDLAGGQKVMRSRTLTADQQAWEMLGDFFNQADPLKPGSLFTEPNHCSAPVMLDDSTWWLIHPLYAKNEWKGQGRQGLINQVRYDTGLKPVADYPVNRTFSAPVLPHSGIPWMVPKSDFFTSAKLNPEWSFLGYTPTVTFSLSERPGWLRLSPNNGKPNTVIKNDGEHNFSLITRVEFDPQSASDEAGLRILRGDEKKHVRIFSSVNASGRNVVVFCFDNYRAESENNYGNIIWLKMVRVNHTISGYFSGDGRHWNQVGTGTDIGVIDSYSDFSSFTGTRQGLYVQNRVAYFDLYIYRDAYSPVLASCPANQSGTAATSAWLDQVHNNDWAMYAGVEFGNSAYGMSADSIRITASGTTGGHVEIWLDSLDSGTRVGLCDIAPTAGWTTYKTFSSKIDPITGCHDLYLRFKGTSPDRLFQVKWLEFVPHPDPLPRVIQARTTAGGDSLILKFNKIMKSPQSSTGEFLILKNGGTSVTVNLLKVDESDSSIYIIRFSPGIFAEENLTLTYSGTGVKSAGDYQLPPFADLPVSNCAGGYPPLLKSAILSETAAGWNRIVLKFDKSLNDVSTQKDYFLITINGSAATIEEITGSADSVEFIIAQSVVYGDSLDISYAAGNITSLNKGILASFTGYIIEYSIPVQTATVELNKKNDTRLFFSSLNHMITAVSENDFNRISIYNANGMLISQNDYPPQTKAATLLIKPVSGLHVVRVTNRTGINDFKVIIQ